MEDSVLSFLKAEWKVEPLVSKCSDIFYLQNIVSVILHYTCPIKHVGFV